MTENGTLRQAVAVDVFRELPEISEDMETRPKAQGCMDFVKELAGSETPEEAITFVAYMFQPRFSVWWGHECLRSHPELLDDQDDQMLGLAASWSNSLDETSRQTALDTAMDMAIKSPGVWLALGAGWSGGSLAPEGLDIVPPPPFITPRCVNGAVLSALARAPLDGRDAFIDEYVNMAGVLVSSA